jgi:hypothetical protein
MPETVITPCTIGIPHFVIVSNMSSYVYRNIRLGFYRDYTITSSAINRVIQGPGLQLHDMVFGNPTTSGMRENGGDET